MSKADFDNWLLDNYEMTRDEYAKEDKVTRRQIKAEYEDYLKEE